MKILLTGATGFIGSQTARALLADGHEVHALIRPTSDLWRIADIQSSLALIHGDVLDRKLHLPAIAYDSCIHCAWMVQPTDYLTSPQNDDHLMAGLQLAQALCQSGCQRLVVTGTCFEYDLFDAGGTHRPISENSALKPNNRYAKAKLDLFKALKDVPLEVTWARLFYQYGPMENPLRLVPIITKKLLRDEKCPLSKGEQIRDFLHVSDVGNALAAVVRSELTGAVNIGSSQPVTVRQIAETIGKITGGSELLQFGMEPNRPGDPPSVVADTVRLRSTGWEPKFTLASGLEQTIEWWRQQLRQGT